MTYRSPLFLALLLSVSACGSSSSDGAAASTQGGGGGTGGAGSGGAGGGTGGMAMMGTDPCAGAAACIGFVAGQSTEKEISTAFATAPSGTTLFFGEGNFPFSNQLTLATAGMIVKGKGLEVTTLDFGGQLAGSESVSVQNSDNFLIQDIGVLNSTGDAVKVEGSHGVTFRNVKVSWTTKPSSSHGPYAVYPVQCSNVLIEGCDISGSADAGIYVGQSDHIVVRNNHAHLNVAGIEIENSSDADVHDNLSEENTAGILVFSLPGLQVPICQRVRVYNNQIKHNMTSNFAAKGGIVSKVPSGVGFFVMAADQVEVFANTFENNGTINAGIISYVLAMDSKPTPPEYYQWPTNIHIHDNTWNGGGDNPDVTNLIGAALADALAKFTPPHVADIVYDGALDAMKMIGPNAKNPMNICAQNNMTASFANLHVDTLNLNVGIQSVDQDATPYDCTIPSLPVVTFPGLDGG